MKKAFLFFICATFLVISSTSPGNAFSLWGGGGGGHGGGGGPAVPPSVFQFDYHSFQYNGELARHDYLADYNSDHKAPDWEYEITEDGGASNPPTNGGSIPVPEPASMLLLGAGLLGLSEYGRRKLN